MEKSKLLGLIGGILLLLSVVLLPWYTVSVGGGFMSMSVSVSGLQLLTGIGTLSSYPQIAGGFGIAMIMAVLALLGGIAAILAALSVVKFESILKIKESMAMMAIGALSAVFCIIGMLTLPSAGASAMGMSATAGPGFGLYLGIIGGALVAVAGFMKK